MSKVDKNKDEMKMIEEMAELIYNRQSQCIVYNCEECEYSGNHKCSSIKKAAAIYNAGYRKIAEDEVVVKKSDYAELNKDFDDWKKEYDHNCLLRLEVFELEKELEKAKQETREILQGLKDRIKHIRNDFSRLEIDWIIAILAQRYGIELK